MNQNMDATRSELPNQMVTKIATSLAVLTAILALAFPLLAWFGSSQHGSDGIFAAIVAALVCWTGASLGMVMIGVMRGPQNGVSGALLAIVFGTGLPLAAGAFLSMGDTPLAKADIFKMILFFYLFTLVVKTTLSVRLVRTLESLSKAP